VNANGSGLHTKALNQHIDEVEKLLAQLKSALPGSTREVNDEDSRPDKPVTPTSPINVPASGRCFLPSLDVSQALVSDYVHDFNKRIPLPAPEAIVFRIRDYYPGVAKGMASSWILTYFVFGIAHQLRALCPSATSYDRSQAEMYLGKCLNVSSTVLLDEPSVRIFQCLLGIGIMMQGSAKSHRVASLVSKAMRMAQELGYNESHDIE
jgi:hypothetical protein